jgi:hypothetical protein
VVCGVERAEGMEGDDALFAVGIRTWRGAAVVCVG